MDHQITIERLVDWDDEDVQNEPKVVTDSVVEFAFGDAPHSYFVTSYPYRAECVDRSDIRTMAIYGLWKRQISNHSVSLTSLH